MVATSTNDPYAILGVDRSASDAVIAAAHRRLARTFHPDVAGDGATLEMMRINAAFDRIRDRKRRARHATEEAEELGTTPRHEAASAPAGTARHAGERSSRWSPPRDGTGGAGKPPGRPSGSVLDFGRHIGWSMGEIARVDPGYLVWLEDRHEGRRYLDEIDRVLRHVGYRRPEHPGPAKGNHRR